MSQYVAQRVYISGPMSGIEHHNYPTFHEVTKKWRDRGWFVQNPAELGGQNMDQPWENFIRTDLIILMQCCDAIALLPGWEHSCGGRIELAIAKAMRLNIYDALTMKQINPSICFVVSGQPYPIRP